MRPSLSKVCARLGASLVVFFAAAGLARCGGQSTLLGPDVSDGATDAATSSGPDGSAVRDAAPDAPLQSLPGVDGSAPDAAHPEAAPTDDVVSDAGAPDVAPAPLDAPEEVAPALPPCGPPVDSTYYVDPLSTFDAGVPMGGRGCPFVSIDQALDAIRVSRLATDASASPATVLLVNDTTAPYLTPDSFTVPADVTIRAEDVTKNTPFLEFGNDAGNFGGTVTMNQPNARLSHLVMDGLRNGIGMSGAGTSVDHVTVENTVFRGIDSNGSGGHRRSWRRPKPERQRPSLRGRLADGPRRRRRGSHFPLEQSDVWALGPWHRDRNAQWKRH